MSLLLNSTTVKCLPEVETSEARKLKLTIDIVNVLVILECFEFSDEVFSAVSKINEIYKGHSYYMSVTINSVSFLVSQHNWIENLAAVQKREQRLVQYHNRLPRAFCYLAHSLLGVLCQSQCPSAVSYHTLLVLYCSPRV